MAPPDDSAPLPHDPAFKAICSHPRAVDDALRGYAAKPNGPLDPRTVEVLAEGLLSIVPYRWRMVRQELEAELRRRSVRSRGWRRLAGGLSVCQFLGVRRLVPSPLGQAWRRPAPLAPKSSYCPLQTLATSGRTSLVPGLAPAHADALEAGGDQRAAGLSTMPEPIRSPMAR